MVFTHRGSIVGAGRLFLKSFSNKLPDLLIAIPGILAGNKLRRIAWLGWLPGPRLLLVLCGELPDFRRCDSSVWQHLNSLFPLHFHLSWYGPEVPDEFSLRRREEDGSVVTWEGPEVPDEFSNCCSEGNGSVVTWEGSEAQVEASLLLCRV